MVKALRLPELATVGRGALRCVRGGGVRARTLGAAGAGLSLGMGCASGGAAAGLARSAEVELSSDLLCRQIGATPIRCPISSRVET